MKTAASVTFATLTRGVFDEISGEGLLAYVIGISFSAEAPSALLMALLIPSNHRERA
jgi:hypothetical protein